VAHPGHQQQAFQAAPEAAHGSIADADAATHPPPPQNGGATPAATTMVVDPALVKVPEQTKETVPSASEP
jgi:hypothetical protein